MLVEIRNLRIQFPTATGLSDAVRNVSLTLAQEKLGIVGESGSGKSLTARSILRLLPSNAIISADKLTFDNIDILHADEHALRRIRGARAGLILQDPYRMGYMGVWTVVRYLQGDDVTIDDKKIATVDQYGPGRDLPFASHGSMPLLVDASGQAGAEVPYH